MWALTMIQQAIEKMVNRQPLTFDEASDSMTEIMNGQATAAQFGAFVTALRVKGETVDEVAGMAQVMREKSLHVQVSGPVVDTCGTGGDGSGTFNISTASALVVAGTDQKVAKHGNRAMSGSSGSADVLEALNVKITLSPEGVERCLDEVGIGFMFAQTFHPSMKFAAGPRREIGIRTVFNILGPLTNPAGATSQVIGVANRDVGELMARVLGILGTKHALIVHGEGAVDEISLSGPTEVWELKGGEVQAFEVSPKSFGLEVMSGAGITVDSVEQSAKTILKVLDGEDGPARNVVLANAAAALLVAGKADSLKEGVERAARSIDSGAAKAKLDAFAQLSQKLE